MLSEFILTEQYHAQQKALLEIIHDFNRRGWSPATSTNYSFRHASPYEHTYTISRSGVDKSAFTLDDFMIVNAYGEPLPSYQHLKPSAETLLHTMLYAQNPTMQCVLHTHSQASTVISLLHQPEKKVRLAGLEVLKGLRGISTHEKEYFVPVFDNSQDMAALSNEVRQYYLRNPDMWGFLLAGHGLYAWGSSIAEAKRHVESLEFLFACVLQLRSLGYTN